MDERGYKGKPAIVTGSETDTDTPVKERLNRDGAVIVVNFCETKSDTRRPDVDAVGAFPTASAAAGRLQKRSRRSSVFLAMGSAIRPFASRNVHDAARKAATNGSAATCEVVPENRVGIFSAPA
jgi:hypothetical protein